VAGWTGLDLEEHDNLDITWDHFFSSVLLALPGQFRPWWQWWEQIDQDAIVLRDEGLIGSTSDVEFVLTADAMISWWKGLALVAGDGRQVELSETEGSTRRGRVFRFNVATHRADRLELKKAKVLGVHTGMYFLRIDQMPATMLGHRWNFEWFADNGPRGRNIQPWLTLLLIVVLLVVGLAAIAPLFVKG